MSLKSSEITAYNFTTANDMWLVNFDSLALRNTTLEPVWVQTSDQVCLHAYTPPHANQVLCFTCHVQQVCTSSTSMPDCIGGQGHYQKPRTLTVFGGERRFDSTVSLTNAFWAYRQVQTACSPRFIMPSAH